MNIKRVSLAGLAVLAVTAVGAQPLLAGGGDDGSGEAPPSEPGLPYVDPQPGTGLTESMDAPEAIVTGGTTYDPTILTKFIPGAGFNPKQGDPGLGYEDVVGYTNVVGEPFACVSSAVGPGDGSNTEFYAGLELPDGSLIKQVVFYGEDNDVAEDITVSLGRTNINVPLLIGVPTRGDVVVNSFNTSGQSGVVAVGSPNNLDEVVGSIGSVLGGFNHRFHTINVTLVNAAGTNHRLCGVEVRYQVPVSAADPGTVFHPISPVRAYDSRNAAYPSPGLLAPNASKVISIKDGHDAAGAVNALDVVPAGATAITYNITIGAPTGPNFVAVTPGDAAGFLASAVNFNGTADIANAATVAIDASRQIKVWGGDQAGSAHVIIDVTGYYTPPVPFPNMGN
jgi:hypothetical protein